MYILWMKSQQDESIRHMLQKEWQQAASSYLVSSKWVSKENVALHSIWTMYIILIYKTKYTYIYIYTEMCYRNVYTYL